MKTHVKSQRELQDYLRVSPTTIGRWQRRYPYLKKEPYRSEDGYDIQAWLAFQQLSQRKRNGETDDEEVNEISGEKLRQLVLQNQKLEVQIGVMKQEYIHYSVVEDSAAKLGDAIKRIVNQLHQQAPQLVGLPVPEAEQRLKEIEDEILTQLNTIDIEEVTKHEQPTD